MHIKHTTESEIPSQVANQYDSYRPYRLTKNSPHLKQSWIVNSKPWIPDSKKWNPDSFSVEVRFWISIVRGILDSLSCTFSRFQSPGFRIPRAKIFRIPLHGAQEILSQEPKCNCNYPVVPVSLGFRFSPVFHAVRQYHLYLH